MLSQTIRDHVVRTYIKPARAKGARSVHVKAGEVHRQLGLYNSVPSVCQALRSKKFEQQGEVELVKVSGPPSGLSTTTEFVFRVSVAAGGKRPASEPKVSLADFAGAGKAYFKAYGGAEKFLKRAREGWTKRVSLRP